MSISGPATSTRLSDPGSIIVGLHRREKNVPTFGLLQIARNKYHLMLRQRINVGLSICLI